MISQESKEFTYTKKIPLGTTILLCMGSVFGAGIYVLIGITSKIAGPSIIIAVLIDLIVALCIAGCYSECASVHPVTGGGFVFVREAYGNDKALFIGWITWLSNMAYAALLMFSVGLFVTEFLNIDSVIVVIIVSIVSCLIFTYINILGSKGLGSIQNPLTIALIGTLIVGAIYLFLQPPQGDFVPFFPRGGYISMFTATALMFDLFIGFEDIAAISGEIKNPKRNVPRALFITLFVSGIIYEIVIISIFFSMKVQNINNSAIPFLDAVKGNAMIYWIVYIGAIFSLLTSLGVALMAASRNLYALSKYDFLDRTWSDISKKHESPAKAIWLSSIIAIIILLTGKVESITSISNVSYMVTVSFVGMAVIKFRKTKTYDKDTFKIPLYPYSAILCIVLPLLLLFFFELNSLLIALVWFLIGLIVYLFFSSKKRIFGTIFLIATFFIAITNIFYGILILIVGILFYLFTIADRYSVIITLAGVKLVAVIILGILVYFIANFSVLSSDISGFTFIFKEILLRIMIWIMVFSLGVIALDVIPLREFVHFFVKKADSGKIAIQIGRAQIIELDKSQINKIYLFNKIIGILQLIFSGFLFIIVSIIFSGLISIETINIAGLSLSEVSSQFLFFSTTLLLSICLLFSGLAWLYFNRGTKEL